MTLFRIKKVKLVISRIFFRLGWHLCPCCFFIMTEPSVLMSLTFYHKDMLEMVTMQKNPAILSIFFVTERTELSAAHA